MISCPVSPLKTPLMILPALPGETERIVEQIALAASVALFWAFLKRLCARL